VLAEWRRRSSSDSRWQSVVTMGDREAQQREKLGEGGDLILGGADRELAEPSRYPVALGD
jgi:hypothetical protein